MLLILTLSVLAGGGLILWQVRSAALQALKADVANLMKEADNLGSAAFKSALENLKKHL